MNKQQIVLDGSGKTETYAQRRIKNNSSRLHRECPETLSILTKIFVTVNKALFVFSILSIILSCENPTISNDDENVLELGTFDGKWEMIYRISKHIIDQKTIIDTMKLDPSLGIIYTIKQDTIVSCKTKIDNEICRVHTFKIDSIVMTNFERGWLSDSIWLDSSKDSLFLSIYSKEGQIKIDSSWVDYKNGETITYLHRK